ncbi:MAG: glycosyltransferase [Paludibacter sp.]
MINVSIVLYNHSLSEIKPLVETLRKSELVSAIFLIDNSPKRNNEFEQLTVDYIFNSKNLGYGTAHNIAIQKTIKQNIPYHLVVNPDISFDVTILAKILHFMDSNPEIGHLMPKVFYPNDEIQFLCKLLPSPFDLIFRRFLPEGWTRKRMEEFELRNLGYNKIMDVPYLSGCFMFLRSEALKKVGLFDERFFMYPEDIDLTRRIHREYRTVYFPDVSIIHHHARDSYVNMKMLWIHTLNMIRYFNKWGWFFDSERKKINKNTLNQFN